MPRSRLGCLQGREGLTSALWTPRFPSFCMTEGKLNSDQTMDTRRVCACPSFEFTLRRHCGNGHTEWWSPNTPFSCPHIKAKAAQGPSAICISAQKKQWKATKQTDPFFLLLNTSIQRLKNTTQIATKAAGGRTLLKKAPVNIFRKIRPKNQSLQTI